MIKVLYAAAEVVPFVKTGGLADAVGALVTTLAERGHEVAAIVPGYRALLDRPEAAGAARALRLHIPMGDVTYVGEVRAFSPRPRLTVYLICRDECFDRRGLYGNGERDYEDNALRFLFFQKGAIEALSLLNGVADIGFGDCIYESDVFAASVPLVLCGVDGRFDLLQIADRFPFGITPAQQHRSGDEEAEGPHNHWRNVFHRLLNEKIR